MLLSCRRCGASLNDHSNKRHEFLSASDDCSFCKANKLHDEHDKKLKPKPALGPSPLPWKFIKKQYPAGPVYWIKSGSVFVGKLYSHDGQPIEENKNLIDRAVSRDHLFDEMLKALKEEHKKVGHSEVQAIAGCYICNNLIPRVEAQEA